MDVVPLIPLDKVKVRTTIFGFDTVPVTITRQARPSTFGVYRLLW